MSKKIRIRVEGKTHTGRLPFEECEYFQVPGIDCPVCAEWTALVKDERVMALFSLEREAAMKQFPGCAEQKYQGPLQVRMPSVSIDGNTFSGDAECTRCRELVGSIVVTTDSIFGIEEDMRVLSGRCRVY